MSRTAAVAIALLACIPCLMLSNVAFADDPPAGQVRSTPAPVELGSSQSTSEIAPTIPQELISPIPAGAQFRRRVVTFATGKVSDATTAGTVESTLIYSNTLGQFVVGGSIGGVRLADDISTNGAQGCLLDRLITHVSGDRDGSGSTLDTPYAVTIALYPTCSGADVSPSPLTGTLADGTIIEAVMTTSFPDGGMYEVVVEFPGVDVELPSNFYFAVTFDRANAGVLVGGLPTIGHSTTRIDFPGLPCRGSFGEFSQFFIHGSFDAQVFVRGPCATQFPGYHTSRQSGPSFTPGSGIMFADDLTLDVDDCRMVAYEVRVKGECATCSGAVFVDLKRSLDPVDPENGNLIPGTSMVELVFGDDVQIVRRDFDPPIQLDSRELFMTFRTTSDVVGPIAAGREASIGQTQDMYMRYLGSPPTGEWRSFLLSQQFASFDVTISCEGSPPVGACCDMIFNENGTCIGGPNDGDSCTSLSDCRTCIGGLKDGVGCRFGDSECPDGECPLIAECVGDTVCRDVPRRNCSTAFEDEFAPLWVQGNVCTDVCVGGSNAGASCTRQAECPGGDCPGPFPHGCGLSACCRPDDTCENLTFRDCLAVPPVENLRQWQRESFCGEGDQRCAFNACLSRKGNCAVEHPEPGCEDPFCCQAICTVDRWCCAVAWDSVCIRESHEESMCRGASNSACFLSRSDRAHALEVNTTTTIATRLGFGSVQDPPFCCRVDNPGGGASLSMWFSFVATETSARVHLCDSVPITDEDTMIQVFKALDPTSLETACNSLDTIACNDDAMGCASGTLSDVCVTDLTPGETYYFVVANKQRAGGDVLELTVEAPCFSDIQLVPGDACLTAEPVFVGSTPFDVTGATPNCPETNCLRTIQTDIWFEWTAPITGEVEISTCGVCAPDDQPCDETTPDTSMIVYEGCDCPIDSASEIACSDSEPSPCFQGSRVRFGVARDSCYKIRVGGQQGSEPSGELSIKVMPCPVADIYFMDPPDNTIDARQPHAVDDATNQQGIYEIEVAALIGVASLECWSLCETDDAGSPNGISSVVSPENGYGAVITLDRPITPGAVTTITYRDMAGTTTTGRFTAHPGNVNGDSMTDSNDLDAMLDRLMFAGASQSGLYHGDIDHSGAIAPPDLLRLIDLLSGGDAFAPGWDETALPTSIGNCP